MLAATGVDADELSNNLLISFTSAFLDQGYAHWPLPDRDRGFYQSFLEVYGQPGGVVPHWLFGLKREIAAQGAANVAGGTGRPNPAAQAIQNRSTKAMVATAQNRLCTSAPRAT